MKIDNKKEKLTDYKRTSERIQKNYFIKADSLRRNMISTIKNAQACLKDIDLIKSRLQIEMDECKRFKTSTILWQDEYVSDFYFFATMIGFIDATIDNCKREINFYSKFLSLSNNSKTELNVKEIEKYKNMITTVMIDRNEILNNYSEVVSFGEIIYPEVYDILNAAPSYLKFSDLYIDSVKNHYSEGLQQRLIDAYNIGYINSDGSYNEKMNIYRDLFEDLKGYLENNKKEIVRIKNKK